MFWLLAFLLPRAVYSGLSCQEACTACDDHANRGAMRQLYCTMCNECFQDRVQGAYRRRFNRGYRRNLDENLEVRQEFPFEDPKGMSLREGINFDDIYRKNVYSGCQKLKNEYNGDHTSSTVPPYYSYTTPTPDLCTTPSYCNPCTTPVPCEPYCTTPQYCQAVCFSLPTCAPPTITHAYMTTTTCRPQTKPLCVGVCMPLCQCPTDQGCNVYNGQTTYPPPSGDLVDVYVGVPKNSGFGGNQENLLRMLLEKNSRRPGRFPNRF